MEGSHTNAIISSQEEGGMEGLVDNQSGTGNHTAAFSLKIVQDPRQNSQRTVEGRQCRLTAVTASRSPLTAILKCPTSLLQLPLAQTSTRTSSGGAPRLHHYSLLWVNLGWVASAPGEMVASWGPKNWLQTNSSKNQKRGDEHFTIKDGKEFTTLHLQYT